MKRLFILILNLVLLIMLSACGQAKTENYYRQISMSQAIEMMSKETDYVILDVRTKEEYEQAHIKGAICIPNEEISNKEISSLPDKNQLIMVYCRSGNRSKQAAAKLVKLGYTNVVEFGGIIDWPGETESGG
jgi:phage shock protein E